MRWDTFSFWDLVPFISEIWQYFEILTHQYIAWHFCVSSLCLLMVADSTKPSAERVIRADYRLAPSQWETSLQSNAISHWLGANLESALWMTIMMMFSVLTVRVMTSCIMLVTSCNIVSSWSTVAPSTGRPFTRITSSPTSTRPSLEMQKQLNGLNLLTIELLKKNHWKVLC